jgi:hypothetical protein
MRGVHQGAMLAQSRVEGKTMAMAGSALALKRGHNRQLGEPDRVACLNSNSKYDLDR